MKTAIPLSEIKSLFKTQLEHFGVTEVEKEIIDSLWTEAMERIEYCFSHSINKYFKREGEAFLNPFHASQWCISLYILSRTIYEANTATHLLCDKIYYLNRMMNGCDLFYEVKLPRIFYLDHPLGAIIGRASIQDGFSFRQGCNVGHNKGVYPVLGKDVKMLSNSRIIGDCKVGDNVIVASGTTIMDQDVPSNSIVFSEGKKLTFKDNVGQYSFG
jgi:serine O-acetyltransferase